MKFLFRQQNRWIKRLNKQDKKQLLSFPAIWNFLLLIQNCKINKSKKILWIKNWKHKNHDIVIKLSVFDSNLLYKIEAHLIRINIKGYKVAFSNRVINNLFRNKLPWKIKKDDMREAFLKSIYFSNLFYMSKQQMLRSYI